MSESAQPSVPAETKTSKRILRDQKRAVIFAGLCWLATVAVPVFYPRGLAVDAATRMSFQAAYGWVAAQGWWLIAAVSAFVLMITRWNPRLATTSRIVLLSLVPLITLLDAITFHWMSERFLSETTSRVLVTLVPGLIIYLSWGSIAAIIAACIGLGGLLAITEWLARWTAGRWEDKTLDAEQAKRQTSPAVLLFIITLVSIAIAIPALRNRKRTVAEMRDHSIRHPLCAFRIVGYRGIGLPKPEGREAVMARMHGLAVAPIIEAKQQELNTIKLDPESIENRPDTIIVIMEALQSGVMTKEIMPSVHAFSDQGYRFEKHLSGGNSSNIGIFSLMYGLESTWFRRADAIHPVMLSLFREAGYELGFFGGSEGWDVFEMEGYIREELFDEYQTETVDWLESDQRSINAAEKFLQSNDRPQLAIVYLYSTHAPFASLPSQEIFQPASGFNFVVPYGDAGREPVFNRYKNAIRSLDHLIKPMLKPDRAIVVAGDHGEAFLEDGTIGHGTRLSATQNMTSGMMYVPGLKPRLFEERTSHADLLPSLIGALGWRLVDEDQNLLEGLDLTRTSDDDLRERPVGSFHYLGPQLILTAGFSASPSFPFALRMTADFNRFAIAPLAWVDRTGRVFEPEPTELSAISVVGRWASARFGDNPLSQELSLSQWLSKHLKNENVEIRRQAIEAVGQLEEPSAEVLESLKPALGDEDKEIAEFARETIVLLKRR
ncbi:MAG: sulfatase-like hydrolase/transferase [Planctomycetota bacterium]